MPAPTSSMMVNFTRLKFQSFAIKLPTSWVTPFGEPAGRHYIEAFDPADLLNIPSPVPPALFLSASPNKYHCKTAKELSDKFGKFIDGICGAICSAWSQWQSAATLTGVLINGPIASMGQVVGPPWTPLILASAPKDTAQEVKYSKAVANAVGTAWQTYTTSIKVPGLPWYPAFAAFPGPVAPPMPNIPAPLMMLVQVPVSLSSMVLKGQMIAQVGDPEAFHHQELFESIADGFEKCFQLWKSSTMVMNVLGTGPVPTFAPPVVPAGPVVMGVGNMVPGGFV